MNKAVFLTLLLLFVSVSANETDNPKQKTEKKKKKRKAKNEVDKTAEFLKYGANYYNSFCAFCHAFNGKGILRAKPDKYMAPPLGGSKRVLGDPDILTRILLNGLTGPVDGKSYLPIKMVAPKSFDNKQIAAILSYIRNSWGNKGSLISEEDVARMKEVVKDRTEPWTIKELEEIKK